MTFALIHGIDFDKSDSKCSRIDPNDKHGILDCNVFVIFRVFAVMHVRYLLSSDVLNTNTSVLSG